MNAILAVCDPGDEAYEYFIYDDTDDMALTRRLVIGLEKTVRK